MIVPNENMIRSTTTTNDDDDDEESIPMGESEPSEVVLSPARKFFF
jgi:hypothetical protein